MIYQWKYKTPPQFADMLMSSDGKYLTGLWFIGSKDESKHTVTYEEKNLPIFVTTNRWLDIYFKGGNPDFTPDYKIENLTPFREKVISIMKSIPYGKTITYNDISKIIAQERNLTRMSSQAVGGAVGWNPICIIIPCHRVVGSDGNLTGYGGGIENKIELLKLENNDMSKFFVKKKIK